MSIILNMEAEKYSPYYVSGRKIEVEIKMDTQTLTMGELNTAHRVIRQLNLTQSIRAKVNEQLSLKAMHVQQLDLFEEEDNA